MAYNDYSTAPSSSGGTGGTESLPAGIGDNPTTMWGDVGNWFQDYVGNRDPQKGAQFWGTAMGTMGALAKAFSPEGGWQEKLSGEIDKNQQQMQLAGAMGDYFTKADKHQKAVEGINNYFAQKGISAGQNPLAPSPIQSQTKPQEIDWFSKYGSTL